MEYKILSGEQEKIIKAIKLRDIERRHLETSIELGVENELLNLEDTEARRLKISNINKWLSEMEKEAISISLSKAEIDSVLPNLPELQVYERGL